MSELAVCKTCNQEVPVEIEQCPNCGKNEKNWFKRHKIMTGFISMFVIIIIIGIIGLVIYNF